MQLSISQHTHLAPRAHYPTVMTDRQLLLKGSIGRVFPNDALRYFEFLARNKHPMTKSRTGRHFSTYVIADANSGVLGFVDIAVDLHPGTFVQQAMKGPIRPQRSAIWFDTTSPSLGISLPDAERNLDILSDSGKMEKWSSLAKQSLAICVRFLHFVDDDLFSYSATVAWLRAVAGRLVCARSEWMLSKAPRASRRVARASVHECEDPFLSAFFFILKFA